MIIKAAVPLSLVVVLALTATASSRAHGPHHAMAHTHTHTGSRRGVTAGAFALPYAHPPATGLRPTLLPPFVMTYDPASPSQFSPQPFIPSEKDKEAEMNAPKGFIPITMHNGESALYGVKSIEAVMACEDGAAKAVINRMSVRETYDELVELLRLDAEKP